MREPLRQQQIDGLSIEAPRKIVERKAMVDREQPAVRQCELPEVARSTAYYEPRPMRQQDLVLMRRIDEPHLK